MRNDTSPAQIGTAGRTMVSRASTCISPHSFEYSRNGRRRSNAKRRVSPGADAFERENPDAAQRGPRDAPQSSGGRESAVVDGGGANNAGEFFSQLATHWKRNYSGWTAWVLSPDMKLPTAMRLKESRRVPMWNGPIECRLFRFDMVSGSARADALTAPRNES